MKKKKKIKYKRLSQHNKAHIWQTIANVILNEKKSEIFSSQEQDESFYFYLFNIVLEALVRAKSKIRQERAFKC